jgi:hypothetical protein
MIWSLDTSLVLIYTVPKPWFMTVQRELQPPAGTSIVRINGSSGNG